MPHYCLHVPLDAHTVRTLRTELDEFLDNAGEFSIVIKTPHGNSGSKELQNAVKTVVVHVLMSVTHDQFEGLN